MKQPNILQNIGIALVCIGLGLFLWIYYPAIAQEFRFITKSFFQLPVQTEVVAFTSDVPIDEKTTIVAVDPEFSIVIPKIGANAKVISSVDPYDADVYQKALRDGVAHAKGTVGPGSVGNIFLFAHSSSTDVLANRYNAVFYLLHRLEKGDEIYLVRHKVVYIYRITEKKIVSPEEMVYLQENTTEKRVTLMTCWPPGTTSKRLIIRGEMEQE